MVIKNPHRKGKYPEGALCMKAGDCRIEPVSPSVKKTIPYKFRQRDHFLFYRDEVALTGVNFIHGIEERFMQL
jgi:hypothetical protein